MNLRSLGEAGTGRHRWLFAITLPLLLLPLVPPTPSAAQEGPSAQTRPLAIADMFQIKRVGAPVVSPDGEWIAYTVNTPSSPEKRGGTQIWMAPTSGEGDPLAMTAKGYSASSPNWSPDGKYLSFMAARGDSAKTQVWVLDRRMGEGQQLTKEKWGINGYEWSPDGTKILLTIRDPDPIDTLQAHKKPKSTPPWEIDRLQFKQDYQGYLTGNRHTHLYVFDVVTKATTPITSGDKDEGSAVWSPDGTRVAFVSNRTEDPDANVDSNIWVVDAFNTDKGAHLTQITTNPGSDGQPAWSPDGEWIAHITSTEPEVAWYDVSHLAVARADGSGEVRGITEELDRNVSSPKYSENGRYIYVGIEDSAEDHVGRVDVRNGRLNRPISGTFSAGGFDLGPDDEVYARIARTDLPGEIFSAEDGELTQLTKVNETFMKKVGLGRTFDATFPSADGTEIEGIFYLPPGYQEGMRYPTILRIHGGPVSQYAHNFNFEAHLFAANGYVVVTTNPRGSSGYGQDFSHAIWADWGTKDSEDVMAGVDYAIEQGWSDADKLGVGGWSYGGILTDHIIVRTDRFKGAISGASEFLYISNYGHDHYQLWWESELGLPWESREVWERISPFNQIEKVTTPTLIMGGEKDWNVPINNSEQLYQALRRMGVETQLVVYPGQSHGLGVPAYQVDRYERYLAWYDKYVKQLTAPVAVEGGAS
jgi:dipeptidyl aminopeptidase/acylaminoacyl peptidase